MVEKDAEESVKQRRSKSSPDDDAYEIIGRSIIPLLILLSVVSFDQMVFILYLHTHSIGFQRVSLYPFFSSVISYVISTYLTSSLKMGHLIYFINIVFTINSLGLLNLKVVKFFVNLVQFNLFLHFLVVNEALTKKRGTVIMKRNKKVVEIMKRSKKQVMK